MSDTSIDVFTSLGDNAVDITSVIWSESLGQPFHAEVHLVCDSATLDRKSVLNQPLSIRLTARDGGDLWLSGIVSRFESLGELDSQEHYRAQVASSFGLLDLSGGCKIYQDLSVLEIIDKVLADHGLAGAIEKKTSQTYAKRPYCVQYAESDFRFLQRLMEEEGIYYFFMYEKAKHTMVLADDLSAHSPTAGYETVGYRSRLHQGTDEYVTAFAVGNSLESSLVVLNDYDFEKPKSPLKVQQKSPNQDASFEWFEYPGRYSVTDDGQRFARIRMESFDAVRELTSFQGNVRGIRSGSLFTVSDHPVDSVNKKYLAKSVNLSIQVSSEDSEEFLCNASITCQDSTLPYRSRMQTPRPAMIGPHVATVCGKAGEEIWTDAYGRIKVQFPWDRDGKGDELSSCWIRVSQSWTGKNWGAVSIPRIGDEVIVEFLDGNPDRPIVTGRLYNAERMPPETLAGAQAKTVFRTRSTKGGDATAFHELTFDDTKDSEAILFQSERDFHRIVENNDTLKVGFEKHTPGDRTVEIYNNENVKVGLGSGTGSHTLEAGKSVLLKCGSSQIEITADSITISSPSITLNATGEFKAHGANVTVQADAAVKINGGAGCNVESGGNLVVKGALVQIN